MKNVLHSIITFLFLLIVSGCSQLNFGYSIISSKNLDYDQLSSYERGTFKSIGEDSRMIILVQGDDNSLKALDRAIETIPGAVALVDGVIRNNSWWAIFVGKSTVIVEGTPLIDPALVNRETQNLNDYSICLMDEEGNLKASKNVNKETFIDLKNKIEESPNRMYRELQK